MQSVDVVDRSRRRRDLPPFRPGDTVRVHVKIQEGEKERIQVFEGVVIRRRRGGKGASFTVRKISYGVGVERIFPVESPNVQKVEIKSRGHVRRSRLYYLRALSGKRARLRSKLRDLSGLLSPEEVERQESGEVLSADAQGIEDVVPEAGEGEGEGGEAAGGAEQAEGADAATGEAEAEAAEATGETQAETAQAAGEQDAAGESDAAGEQEAAGEAESDAGDAPRSQR